MKWIKVKNRKDELIESMMQLPEKERLAIASKAWVSCQMPFELLDQLQAAISVKILEEMESGADSGVDMSESIRKARSAIS